MTRPVAFLHGFTGSPRSFDGVSSRLPSDGLRVDAPSLLGHGPPDGEAPPAIGFEAEVERLARHFAARGSGYHLVGYSLGGRLAIGLLCRHSRLFSSATLISAQPGLTTESERAERRTADERWCELLEQRGLAAFVDAWEAIPLFATQTSLPDAVRARQRAERLAQDPAGLVQSLRRSGLGVMPSYWEALGGLQIPTTFVVGIHDGKFVAIAERMRAVLPGADLVVVPDAGHNVVLEKPDAIAELVSRQVTK